MAAFTNTKSIMEDEERKKKNLGRKRLAVDYEAFITTYMDVYRQGGNCGDLCRILDLPYTTVKGREQKLKESGVALPLLARGSQMSNMQTSYYASLVKKLESDDLPRTGMKKPPIV